MKIKALTIAAMLVVAAVALVGCSAPAPAPTAAPAATATAAPVVTEAPATAAPVVTEAPAAVTEAPAAATEAPAATTVAAPAQLELTVDELAAYDGKDGKPAYVAIKGVVYDVTNVAAWKDGMHKNGLTAGKDLTNEITKSPHGEGVLKNLPVVGKLK
jgi:predicted heme/steroid binding protein